MVKRVMCFGDSNTWGYTPLTGARYPEDVRYTGVLQHRLGAGYRVIEEGLNGRTTAFPDLLRKNRAGIEHMEPILLSQLPLDYLIFMLGTNDTKVRYNAAPEEIGMGMENLIVEANNIFRGKGSDCAIILTAPVPMQLADGDDISLSAKSAEKSRQLAPVYREIAKLHGCHFLDLAEVTDKVGEDGVHLSPEAHRAIGVALADLILNLDASH